MTTFEVKKWLYRHLEQNNVSNLVARRVDRGLIVFIFAAVFLALMETVSELKAEYGPFFYWSEFIIGVGFTIEYMARLWLADLYPPLRRFGPVGARLRYAIQPAAIIDLVAVLPFVISLLIPAAELKILIVIRLLRLLKLARYSPALRSLTSALASERHALMASFIIVIIVMIFSATGMYFAERHAQPDNFSSIPAAMWWAVTTLTTVGYGDVTPITVKGKTLAGLVMLIGYGMFALPVGIVATAFAREIHSRDFSVTWGMVARVPLFEELHAHEIAEIAKLLRAQSVGKGQVITRRGDEALSMYFIASGVVEVRMNNHSIRLTDGGFFGEMAIIGRHKRAATVVSVEPAQLMILDTDDLRDLMTRKPQLADRLKEATEERIAHLSDNLDDLAPDDLAQVMEAVNEYEFSKSNK